ncbi:MAG: hypothetical protein KIT39_06155 [Nitrospirales bacterium]|nr:hypothetical protein [Nitrospirales bacterium]
MLIHIQAVIFNSGERYQQVVEALLGYGRRISVVGRSGGTVPEFNTSTLFFAVFEWAEFQLETIPLRKRSLSGKTSSVG